MPTEFEHSPKTTRNWDVAGLRRLRDLGWKEECVRSPPDVPPAERQQLATPHSGFERPSDQSVKMIRRTVKQSLFLTWLKSPYPPLVLLEMDNGHSVTLERRVIDVALLNGPVEGWRKRFRARSTPTRPSRAQRRRFHPLRIASTSGVRIASMGFVSSRCVRRSQSAPRLA